MRRLRMIRHMCLSLMKDIDSGEGRILRDDGEILVELISGKWDDIKKKWDDMEREFAQIYVSDAEKKLRKRQEMAK